MIPDAIESAVWRKRGRGALSSRRGGASCLRRSSTGSLRAGDHGRCAHGLQGSDGLRDEGGLLFDDGVIDGSAKAFVEDFDAVEFSRGSGAVFVGRGDGDVEGKDLIGIPGKCGFFESWGAAGRSALAGDAHCVIYKLYIR